MKAWTFNEYLGLILALVLAYLLAYKTMPPEVSTTFRDILIIIAYFFFRKRPK